MNWSTIPATEQFQSGNDLPAIPASLTWTSGLPTGERELQLAAAVVLAIASVCFVCLSSIACVCMQVSCVRGHAGARAAGRPSAERQTKWFSDAIKRSPWTPVVSSIMWQVTPLTHRSGPPVSCRGTVTWCRTITQFKLDWGHVLLRWSFIKRLISSEEPGICYNVAPYSSIFSNYGEFHWSKYIRDMVWIRTYTSQPFWSFFLLFAKRKNGFCATHCLICHILFWLWPLAESWFHQKFSRLCRKSHGRGFRKYNW